MTVLADPVPRFTTPQPSEGPAPSFQPADAKFAPGIGVARKLGWFSIGLGLAEILAPKLMSELTGVRNERLLQMYGLREFVCGVGILTSDRPVGWLWARVAGDAMDLGTLAVAGEDHKAAGLAAAAVAGVTAVDLACATALTGAAAVEGAH